MSGDIIKIRMVFFILARRRDPRGTTEGAEAG
jgi:hypothetical protein